MSNPADSEDQPTQPVAEGESFKDILSQFEQSHSHKPQKEEGSRRIEATVVTLTADSILLDIGFKTEGILPLTALPPGETVKPGDKLLVTVKGRDPEGYYEVALGKISRPTDWASLEQAFNEKATIVGTVMAAIKGGLSVDVGVRAFMPASRSGVRDTAEMEKLVGQEIRCRITKLDVTEEDVVVDRRIITEEDERATKERRYTEIQEGETVRGTVRSLADYGAFVDIGGVEGLIHVSEMSWSKKVRKPSDAVKIGEIVEAVILGVNVPERRISLGLKQALGDPWIEAAKNLTIGSVIEGPVVSITKFGAFVQIAEGVEGMIHVSEISAEKRINHPQDVLKVGQTVKAQVLDVDGAKRNVRLSIKQMVPSSLDEYIAEHKEGDVVTGRMKEVSGGLARVELGEGVVGTCRIVEDAPAQEEKSPAAKAADLSSLSSMLQSRWKSGAAPASGERQGAQAGQIRSFRIARLDPAAKKIEL